MKPDEYFIPYAESAYLAYEKAQETPGWESSMSEPDWNELTPWERNGWVAAVKDVFHKLQVRDASGALFVE